MRSKRETSPNSPRKPISQYPRLGAEEVSTGARSFMKKKSPLYPSSFSSASSTRSRGSKDSGNSFKPAHDQPLSPRLLGNDYSCNDNNSTTSSGTHRNSQRSYTSPSQTRKRSPRSSTSLLKNKSSSPTRNQTHTSNSALSYHKKSGKAVDRDNQFRLDTLSNQHSPIIKSRKSTSPRKLDIVSFEVPDLSINKDFPNDNVQSTTTIIKRHKNGGDYSEEIQTHVRPAMKELSYEQYLKKLSNETNCMNKQENIGKIENNHINNVPHLPIRIDLDEKSSSSNSDQHFITPDNDSSLSKNASNKQQTFNEASAKSDKISLNESYEKQNYNASNTYVNNPVIANFSPSPCKQTQLEKSQQNSFSIDGNKSVTKKLQHQEPIANIQPTTKTQTQKKQLDHFSIIESKPIIKIFQSQDPIASFHPVTSNPKQLQQSHIDHFSTSEKEIQAKKIDQQKVIADISPAPIKKINLSKSDFEHYSVNNIKENQNRIESQGPILNFSSQVHSHQTTSSSLSQNNFIVNIPPISTTNRMSFSKFFIAQIGLKRKPSVYISGPSAYLNLINPPRLSKYTCLNPISILPKNASIIVKKNELSISSSTTIADFAIQEIKSLSRNQLKIDHFLYNEALNNEIKQFHVSGSMNQIDLLPLIHDKSNPTEIPLSLVHSLNSITIDQSKSKLLSLSSCKIFDKKCKRPQFVISTQSPSFEMIGKSDLNNVDYSSQITLNMTSPSYYFYQIEKKPLSCQISAEPILIDVISIPPALSLTNSSLIYEKNSSHSKFEIVRSDVFDINNNHNLANNTSKVQKLENAQIIIFEANPQISHPKSLTCSQIIISADISSTESKKESDTQKKLPQLNQSAVQEIMQSFNEVAQLLGKLKDDQVIGFDIPSSLLK